MTFTRGRNWQTDHEDALPSLGRPALSNNRDIVNALHREITNPLTMHAASPTPNSRLYFAPTQTEAGDGAKKTVPPLTGVIPSFGESYIDFQTQTTLGSFLISWPATNTVGQYRRAGFTLISSGDIQVLISIEAPNVASLPDAGALIAEGIPLGFIDLQCTNVLGYFKSANASSDVIENNTISRFVIGGGGGGGSVAGSGGGELSNLQYKAALRDSFEDRPDGFTPVDNTLTDPLLYSNTAKYFRLAYDANMVATVFTTSVTLVAAPSFTVKVNDVIIWNGQVRMINSVISQTEFTIDSVFIGSIVAENVCISQAVHTVDLNAFDQGGSTIAAGSLFTDDIDEALISVEDSMTDGDVISDWGVTPHVAFSASADNLNWTEAKTRPIFMIDKVIPVIFPVVGNQFYIRFFANKTSGSGFVNVLGYKAFWHRELATLNGESLFTAFARILAGEYVNCSHTVVGGKSRLTFNQAYPVGLNPGEPCGSALEIYINGQFIPRLAPEVDLTGGYFVEINAETIELDLDYSTFDADIQIKVPATIIDSNTQNTTRIVEFLAQQEIKTLSNNFEVMNVGYHRLDCSAGSRTFYVDPNCGIVKFKRVDTTGNTCTITSAGNILTFDGNTSFNITNYESGELRRIGTGVERWT